MKLEQAEFMSNAVTESPSAAAIRHDSAGVENWDAQPQAITKPIWSVLICARSIAMRAASAAVSGVAQLRRLVRRSRVRITSVADVIKWKHCASLLDPDSLPTRSRSVRVHSDVQRFEEAVINYGFGMKVANPVKIQHAPPVHLTLIVQGVVVSRRFSFSRIANPIGFESGQDRRSTSHYDRVSSIAIRAQP